MTLNSLLLPGQPDLDPTSYIALAAGLAADPMNKAKRGSCLEAPNLIEFDKKRPEVVNQFLNSSP
jgi:hypothetical protein